MKTWLAIWIVCLGCYPVSVRAGETFRVGTYNLGFYSDQPDGTRPAKNAESKAKIRESIRLLKADVLALQEMASRGDLLELQRSLKEQGMDYPHAVIAYGWDTNIHVALLSRFPITACKMHTNETYLLMGRRMHVQRGFLEADISVNDRYSFTLFTAHLKSRRQQVTADEAEMRQEEALLLRDKIELRLKANPSLNLVVLGDLNDTKDSKPIRTVIGRGRQALVDTRPAEQNGDDQPAPRRDWDAPWITWTHYYGKEDTYSRIDYILISSGMAKEWNKKETRVLVMPNWGVASDHRPIVAAFEAVEK